jgi:hypothetical protein
MAELIIEAARGAYHDVRIIPGEITHLAGNEGWYGIWRPNLPSHIIYSKPAIEHPHWKEITGFSLNFVDCTNLKSREEDLVSFEDFIRQTEEERKYPFKHYKGFKPEERDYNKELEAKGFKVRAHISNLLMAERLAPIIIEIAKGTYKDFRIVPIELLHEGADSGHVFYALD